MEQTHIHKNITDLEVVLDTIAVEEFISELGREVKYLDNILVEKPWEQDDNPDGLDAQLLMTDEEVFRFQQAQLDNKKLVNPMDK